MPICCTFDARNLSCCGQISTEKIKSMTTDARNVDRVYDQLKLMAINYKFRPDQRINEVELARSLNVSRTPVREALNRLCSEGFLTSLPNRGFFGRSLDPKQVLDLYELRCAVELFAVGLLVKNATDQELDELEKFARIPESASAKLNPLEILELDEQFHLRIAKLSGNQELVRALGEVNAKVHFTRWVDYQTRKRDEDAHPRLVRAFRKRDVVECQKLMLDHIAKRADEIRALIRTAFAEIYMGPDEALELTQPKKPLLSA